MVRKFFKLGLWISATFLFLIVFFFHLSLSFMRYPALQVQNFADPANSQPMYNPSPDAPPNPGNTGIFISHGGISAFGLGLGKPLSDFEKAFNRQLEQQNDERSTDYRMTAAADFAAFASSLIALLAELYSQKPVSNEEEESEGETPAEDEPRGEATDQISENPRHETRATGHDADPG